MSKYKVAVFDMDGTVLDTLADMHACVNHILSSYGCPTRTYDEVRSFVGNGIGPLLARSFPADYKKDDKKVFGEFMDYYREHCVDKTKPYDGITKLLSDLKDSGVKIAIVSNKPHLAVNQLAERFFSGLYDVAVGEIEGLAKKPAPDEVFYALDQLGENKTAAVYIGDSDVDLMTAKNSGLDCISVSWGFKTKEFLMSLGAKTIVDEPSEALEKII